MPKLISFFTGLFAGVGDTNWSKLLANKIFKTLPTPQFPCATFKGVSLTKWNNLNIDTIESRNKARAGGVDDRQIQGIISTLRQGYDPTQTPPIVMIMPDGTTELWDGYHRYCAAEALSIPDFPCLVYKLNAEWEDRPDDAYDIVSLGANNHPTAKRHTEADFITRGVLYSKRHGNLSLSQLRDWVNSIDHFFTDKQVDTIAKKIFHRTTIAVNVKPYHHPKIARAKVSEVVGDGQATPSRNPVIMCCKEDEYIERALLQIMMNPTDPVDSIETTEVVAYTKGCETAEQVVAQRERAINKLKELERRVLAYAAHRLTHPDAPAYTIAGFLPQLVDVEDMSKLVDA